MFDLDPCLKMRSKIRSRSLVWKKNLSHFFVKWSDMISDHLNVTKLTVPKQASQWVALIWKSAYLYPISKRPKPMSEEE